MARLSGRLEMTSVRLWSYHTKEFSLTEGDVDHVRSRYYQESCQIRKAYDDLFHRLGEDQIIWCHTNQGEYKRTGIPKVEWVLDVSESDVIAFVDGFIWNRIIGIRSHPPRRLNQQWKSEAISCYPNDVEEQRRHISVQADFYWNQSPPRDGWWSELFVENSAAEGIDALIRHPIPSGWVKSRQPV